MTPKAHAMEISAICGFFILLALGGVAWDISSGLLTSGIDGIMLLFVCAMMAGIFFLIMLAQLIKSGIIPTPKFMQPEAKPAPVAKAPAAAAPAAVKPVARATPFAGVASKPAAPPVATAGAANPGPSPAAAPAKPVSASTTPATTPANGPSAAPLTTPSTPTTTPEK